MTDMDTTKIEELIKELKDQSHPSFVKDTRLKALAAAVLEEIVVFLKGA